FDDVTLANKILKTCTINKAMQLFKPFHELPNNEFCTVEGLFKSSNHYTLLESDRYSYDLLGTYGYFGSLFNLAHLALLF
ncbi:6049_t:CDS:1, partial [Funneliformis mosseae]